MSAAEPRVDDVIASQEAELDEEQEEQEEQEEEQDEEEEEKEDDEEEVQSRSPNMRVPMRLDESLFRDPEDPEDEEDEDEEEEEVEEEEEEDGDGDDGDDEEEASPTLRRRWCVVAPGIEGGVSLAELTRSSVAVEVEEEEEEDERDGDDEERLPDEDGEEVQEEVEEEERVVLLGRLGAWSAAEEERERVRVREAASGGLLAKLRKPSGSLPPASHVVEMPFPPAKPAEPEPFYEREEPDDLPYGASSSTPSKRRAAEIALTKAQEDMREMGLEVLRHMPDEDEQEVATSLSITFNQPMVALTSHDQLAKSLLPVTIEPEVPGEWFWLDPKTLAFECEDERFPMSTRFRVTVPANIRALSGAVLSEPYGFSFSTGTPRVLAAVPLMYQSHVSLTTPLIIVFNQRVDPEEVAACAQLRSQGLIFGTSYPIELIRESQEQARENALADATVQQMGILTPESTSERNTVVRLRLTRPLERGTSYKWWLSQPVASLEGPRVDDVSPLKQSVFETFGKLELKSPSSSQAWTGHSSPFQNLLPLVFNNPLDPDAFRPDQVSIQPELPGMNLHVQDRQLLICGRSQPRTTYRVKVAGTLTDAFGQMLGEPRTVQMKISAASQELEVVGIASASGRTWYRGGDVVTLDPLRKTRHITLRTCNFEHFRLRVYATRPEHFRQFSHSFVRDMQQWERIEYRNFPLFFVKKPPGERPEPPGAFLLEEFVVRVADFKPDEKVLTHVDLSRFAEQATGHLIIGVDVPTEELTNSTVSSFHRRPFGIDFWAQLTSLGATVTAKPVAAAAAGGKPSLNLLVKTVNLSDGSPFTDPVDVWQGDGFSAQQILGKVEGGLSQLLSLPVFDPLSSQSDPDSQADASLPLTHIVLISGHESTFVSIDDAARALRKSHGDAPLVASNSGAADHHLVFHALTDRDLYRPGDVVHVKGVCRVVDQSKSWQPRFVPRTMTEDACKFTLLDAFDNELAKGDFMLDSAGEFSFNMVVPDHVPGLGRCTVRMQYWTNGETGWRTRDLITLSVQEFRRHEFEVEVTRSPWSQQPSYFAGSADLATRAFYFSGGALGNTPFKCAVSWADTEYVPPNWSGWSFTPAEPTLSELEDEVALKELSLKSPELRRLFREVKRSERQQDDTFFKESLLHGFTDPDGFHYLHLDFGDSPNRSEVRVAPQLVTVQSTIVDHNNQEQSGSLSFVVHPAERYVGLRTIEPRPNPLQPFEVEAVVVDVDGNAIDGAKVELSAFPTTFEWSSAEHAYVNKIVGDGFSTEAETQRPDEDAEAPPKVSVHVPLSDASPHYIVRATTFDEQGRKSTTQISVLLRRPSDEEMQTSVGAQRVADALLQPTSAPLELTADKDVYQPGDEARLVLKSAVAPAHALILFDQVSPFVDDPTEQTLFFEHRELELDEDGQYEFTVPIRKEHIPNLPIVVQVTGTAPRVDDHGDVLPRVRGVPLLRSVIGTASIELEVSTDGQELKVDAVPAVPVLSPGEETCVDLIVCTHDGEPARDSSVTVVVVDESILALAGYRWASPTRLFFPQKHSTITLSDTYATLLMLGLDPAGAEEEVNDGVGDQVPRLDLSSVISPTRGLRARARKALLAPFVSGPRGGAPILDYAGMGFYDEDEDVPTRVSEAGGEVPSSRSNAGGGSALEDTPQAGEEPEAPVAKMFRLRSDFNPVALWAAHVVTNTRGRCSVEYTMPDTVSRYRVMAFATHGSACFGVGEASITARLPITLRPSLPRFLQHGDECMLQFVVHNQTEQEICARLTLRSLGLELNGDSAQQLETDVFFDASQVRIPKGERRRVRFSARAAWPRQDVLLQSAVFIDNVANPVDAVESRFSVLEPITSESFALYGNLGEDPSLPHVKGDHVKQVAEGLSHQEDEPVEDEQPAGKKKRKAKKGPKPTTLAVQVPVQVPEHARTDFGALEVSLSSTLLVSLADAVEYVVHYPFECMEQLSSKLIAMVCMRDAMAALGSKAVPANELSESVYSIIATLAQNQDNILCGFGFWGLLGDEDPYLSVHVAHACARAVEKGFDVPKVMMQRLRRYLRRLSRHIPVWYPQQVRAQIKAYGLYVLNLPAFDDCRSGEAIQLIKDQGGVRKTPLEALGLLLPTLMAGSEKVACQRIVRRLEKKVVDVGGNRAHFVQRYSQGAHLVLHSTRRCDAIMLDALCEFNDPTSRALVPKLCAGLLAARRKGRWSTTHENCWAIVALDHYFQVSEAAPPQFAANIWLRGQHVGGTSVRKYTTDVHQVSVPMDVVAQELRQQPLLLARHGTGRMYYRVALRYAPEDVVREPRSRGFKVKRKYEALDAETDVRVDESERTVRVREGARVRVTISLAALTRRYHVALVDNLPAGFEVKSASQLAGQQHGPSHVLLDQEDQWYRHVNVRDSRVEIFADVLWGGEYTVSYIATATCAGRFIAAPAYAEEMYDPEVFGSTWTEFVVVE